MLLFSVCFEVSLFSWTERTEQKVQIRFHTSGSVEKCSFTRVGEGQAVQETEHLTIGKEKLSYSHVTPFVEIHLQ